MEINVHFEDIQDKIINQLNCAKYNIFVAVAWITDQVLWDILLQKALDELNVQIILNADEINLNNKFGIEKFKLLWQKGFIKFNDIYKISFKQFESTIQMELLRKLPEVEQLDWTTFMLDCK